MLPANVIQQGLLIFPIFPVFLIILFFFLFLLIVFPLFADEFFPL